VNCFQNLYLWLSETALCISKRQYNSLWIAFKICIFDFQKQRWLWRSAHNVGCELLSKFVSLTFRNSAKQVTVRGNFVVNCFQNLYLWLSETAVSNSLFTEYVLWIAFKICIFDFQKQPEMREVRDKPCCELLSKFVSLTFRNSNKKKETIYMKLWIAFKICIFDFQKQHKFSCTWNGNGCELLSKFVSLTFRNSTSDISAYLYKLWIAFKICIFDFQKQHSAACPRWRGRCELLSKFVSLTFRNSGGMDVPRTMWVVNCFQNLYLWLSETAIEHFNFSTR